MGTLPIIFICAENQFLLFSVNARNKIAGPNVTSKYKSDGGYFETLRNDNNVKIPVDCMLHREGSPYTFMKRNTKNKTIAPVPS